MNYEDMLIERIESFVDVVDNFVRIEHQIITDSKYRPRFNKPDYDTNILMLNDIKILALSIDTDDIEIPADDDQSIELADRFERCLVMFNKLCDGFIEIQEQLKLKANKEKKLKIREYQEMLIELQSTRNLMNSTLKEFDEAYTEYAAVEEDDEE